MQSLKVSVVSTVCLALAVSACNNAHGKPKPKPAPSAKTAATKPAPAASTAAPAPKPAVAERPRHIDTELTAARREKIDKAYPKTKGFVVLKDLEAKLKKEKLKDKKKGMLAFDRLAKNKWVLFTGPSTDADAKGFALGVTYTPRMKGDRLGLSRQFFLVKLSDVKGYTPDTMKSGTEVVVLAKYLGKGKASPGYELVAEHNW